MTGLAPLVDTHAHVDYIVRAGGNADDVMKDCREEGLTWLLNPGTHPDYFDEVLALADTYPEIYAALAVHPTDVQETDWDSVFADIRQRAKHWKVIALGETGLDYYHDDSYKAMQHRFFERFLQMADEMDLPIIVHCRDKNNETAAFEDTAAIVKNFPNVRGVMHCFAGDTAFAKTMIDLGFYISFAGNLTFKKASNLHESAMGTPLDWMLIETDSPFLSPEPFRGKPNAPNRVSLVAEKVAELKGLSVDAVRRATAENAECLFRVCPEDIGAC